MAQVELAAAAVDDLDARIATHSLPSDARARVRRSLAPRVQCPRPGRELTGRWADLRVVLGPWRWMLFVCEYDEATDRVVVLTTQDARSSHAATSA